MGYPLCKDCKFFYSDSWTPGGCIKKPDPVTGKPDFWAGSARSQRSDPHWIAVIFGKCGKSGRWFEAK